VTQSISFETFNSKRVEPQDTLTEIDVISADTWTYWQHLGFDTSLPAPPYKSARVGAAEPIGGEAVFTQQISIEDQTRIQFDATFEVSGEKDVCGRAPEISLFVRAMDLNQRALSIEFSRLEAAQNPTNLRVELLPPPMTSAILVGGVFSGPGSARVADLSLVGVNRDGLVSSLPLSRTIFKDSERQHSVDGWKVSGDAYTIETPESPTSGSPELLISRKNSERVVDPIFEEAPAMGAHTTVSLEGSLEAKVPLSILTAIQNSSWDEVPQGIQSQRLRYLRSVRQPAEVVNSNVLALASVIEIWNLLEHSYPYWDTVKINWEKELTEALRAAYVVESIDDIWWLLNSLPSEIGDGHANVYHNSQREFTSLPFYINVIEDRAYVGSEAPSGSDPDRCVKVGDRIVAVNTHPVMKQIRKLQAFVSGSRQHKEYQAANFLLGRAKEGSVIELLLESSDGAEASCNVLAGARKESRWDHPAIASFDEDTIFIDLSRLRYDQILERSDDLQAANKIIFDLREYLSSDFRLLGHFFKEPFKHHNYLTPQIIRPSMMLEAQFYEGIKEISPAEPFLGDKKIIFLVGASTISANETLIEIASSQGIGTVIGETTAGVTGNINRAPLPGGFFFTWTGMRYERDSGDLIHGIGILPDIYVKISPAMLSQRKDASLEIAKEL